MTAEGLKYLQSRIARFDDQKAYKELFTTLYSPLFLFAKSMVKSRESAEEIVSDVFIRIWEKRRDLEKIDNLRVYLYVSTRNAALNCLSLQKRTSTNPLDEFSRGIHQHLFDPEQLADHVPDMLRAYKKNRSISFPPNARSFSNWSKKMDSIQGGCRDPETLRQDRREPGGHRTPEVGIRLAFGRQ